MNIDEIKAKIKALLNTVGDEDVDIDFDSLDVKRVDDGVFKVVFLCNLNEDEEEEDEDDGFNEEEVEADESDFEDS